MNSYVIILNWNGFKDTIPCLESLLPHVSNDTCVVVCDNASSDGSIDHIDKWLAASIFTHTLKKLKKSAVMDGAKAQAGQLVVIQNGANLGFAGGNNPGIQLALNDAECEFIWLLNNDTTVDATSLSAAIARMQQDPNMGLCGSSLIYAHSPNHMQAFGGSTYSPLTGRSAHIGAHAPVASIPDDPTIVEQQLAMIVGAAMLVRRRFVETIGLMREDYFLYCEEIDWATRGKGKFTLGYAPQSRVWHKEGGSIGTHSSGGSPLSLYYLYRNRLLFTWRFYPLCFLSVLFFCAIDLAKLVVRGRWPQFFAGMRGVFRLSPPPHKSINKT